MSIEKINKCCLICTSTKSIRFICIHENNFELLKKITEYLPIQLEACNVETAKCCEECVEKICDWDKFYKHCKEKQSNEGILLQNISNTCDKDVVNKSTERDLITSQTKRAEDMEEDVREEACKIPSTLKKFAKTHEETTCFFCDSVHTVTEELSKHLVNEHSEMIFCCDVCNKYLPRQQLMAHMTGHANKSVNISNTESSSEKNNLKCDKCQRIFRSFSGIKYHMNSKHLKLKKYDCEICSRSFTSKRVLLNHKRSNHNRNKRQYACLECGKAFKTDSTLYTHVKLHKNSKPFECLHCDKSFRLKHHLTSHMVQHTETNEKTWECDFCHKRFAALDNLRKHKKIHDPTNGDFVCHICDAKMKQSRYLREHMKKVHLQGNKKQKIKTQTIS